MIARFDIVRACRSCRSRPLFVLTVALIIMIAAAASTVAFSVGRAILWEDLPYRDADRLVIVSGSPRLPLVRETTYRAFSDQLATVEAACLWRTESVTLTGAGRPERIGGVVSTASFFEVLGAVPSLGRTFVQEEEELGRRNVILVSEEFWRNRLDGSDSAVGKTVRLDGELVTVIGVMPRSFRFPTSPNHLMFDSIPPVAYWRPVGDPNRDSKSLAVQLNNLNHSMLVKITRHAKFEDLEIESTTVLAGLKERYPDGYSRQQEFILTKLTEELQGRYRLAMMMFLAAVLAFCCMASLNIATLLLVQAIDRRREFAIGHALGGTQFHTLMQLAIEMIIVVVIAAGGAWVLSQLGLKVLKWFAPPALLQVYGASVEPWSLALSIAMIVITSTVAVFTLIFRMTGAHRSSSALGVVNDHRASGTVSVSKALSALLILQISIASVLVCGGVLLARSFVSLIHENPGFTADELITARIDVLPTEFRNSPARIDRMFIDIIDSVHAIPGVIDVGAVDIIPLAGARNISTTTPYGGSRDDEITAEYRWTIKSYFDTMKIPLVKGRAFTLDDRSPDRFVAVVSETFARLMWPNEDPIAKRFKRSTADRPSNWYTVVGVVGDIRNHGLDQVPRPQVYFAQPYSSTTIVVRSSRDPASLTGEIQSAIWKVNPSVPISNISTMDKVVGNSIAREEFSLVLAVLLAVVSFSLSLFGVISVASYITTQQSHSIGIRLAVGATSQQITWSYVRRTLAIASAGLVLAIGALSFLQEAAEGLLHGVGTWDVLTLLLVCVTTLLATTVATVWTLRSMLSLKVAQLIQ